MTDDEEAVANGNQAASEWRQTERAFDTVEAAIMRELANTPIGQEAKVLNLHKSLQNLSAVKLAVLNVIQNGQIAQHALSEAGLTSPN